MGAMKSRPGASANKPHPGMPRIEERGGTYFISFTMDRSLPPLSPAERQVVFDIITAGNGTRYRLFIAVVMPDHVHLVLQAVAQDGPVGLPKIMHRLKGFSALQVNKLRGRKGALWEARSHNRLIYSKKELEKMMNYIYMNPRENELAENPDDYPYLWRIRSDIKGKPQSE